jgi:hypothetical protein
MKGIRIKSVSKTHKISPFYSSDTRLKANVRFGTGKKASLELVTIRNYSDSTYFFPFQDGKVITIREAEINPGEWLPVEYWVHSWCGNSYDYSRKLEPGKEFGFTAFRMKGSKKVKMRYRVQLAGKGNILYSEPFPGRINICQVAVPEDLDPAVGNFIDFLN